MVISSVFVYDVIVQGTPSILIIEDDADIAEMVELAMEREGYQTQIADGAVMAFRYLKTRTPDVILLDIMLPGTDGVTILKRLKQSSDTAHIPVIMVTAKSSETDQVLGLELGADDYVTKPFSPRVLQARVRRLLRRNEPQDSPDIIRIGDLEIHPKGYAVRFQGEPLNLTKAEFNLLCLLAERPGWVFSREQILEAASPGGNIAERAIDVQVVGLRKKMGAAGDMIRTVRGAGYKIEARSQS